MEQDSGSPDTVVLDGSPNVTEGSAPEQIYVQGGQLGPGGLPPTTNATVALILTIVGLVMCGLCTAIPGLILANGALATTNQYPGHPDAGVAKAAQVVGWVTIVIWSLIILLYVALFGFVGVAIWSESV
tara:strand:+ start:865 stop:1251 length:387 start_codon:yes stop_codon:yes gene_type:complete